MSAPRSASRIPPNQTAVLHGPRPLPSSSSGTSPRLGTQRRQVRHCASTASAGTQETFGGQRLAAFPAVPTLTRDTRQPRHPRQGYTCVHTTLTQSCLLSPRLRLEPRVKTHRLLLGRQGSQRVRRPSISKNSVCPLPSWSNLPTNLLVERERKPCKARPDRGALAKSSD